MRWKDQHWMNSGSTEKVQFSQIVKLSGFLFCLLNFMWKLVYFKYGLNGSLYILQTLPLFQYLISTVIMTIMVWSHAYLLNCSDAVEAAVLSLELVDIHGSVIIGPLDPLQIHVAKEPAAAHFNQQHGQEEHWEPIGPHLKVSRSPFNSPPNRGPFYQAISVRKSSLLALKFTCFFLLFYYNNSK